MKRKPVFLVAAAIASVGILLNLVAPAIVADDKTDSPSPGVSGKGKHAGKGAGSGMKAKMPEFEPLAVSEEEAAEPVSDSRIYVPMPAEQKAILREQMRGFLVTLAQIQGLMADGKLDEAAKIAETNMGRSERGQHKGKGPGLYMPIPMRTLAWDMHEKASEFAETASQGDVLESYRSLQKLQTSCVSCHFSYSTR